jgi:hypothetical protein
MVTQEEWLARYKQRFIEVGISEEGAQMQVESATFEEHSVFFEDDPEGAADEEMSYWTDDGD